MNALTIPRDRNGRLQPALRAVPEDFAQIAPRLTLKRLVEHYQASQPVVRRWCATTGVKPKPFTPLLLRSLQGPAPQVDESRAGRAAHHLRRKGFANVYRVEVLPLRERKHLPGAGVGLYLVAGKGHLDVGAMIALAERYGFEG